MKETTFCFGGSDVIRVLQSSGEGIGVLNGFLHLAGFVQTGTEMPPPRFGHPVRKQNNGEWEDLHVALVRTTAIFHNLRGNRNNDFPS